MRTNYFCAAVLLSAILVASSGCGGGTTLFVGNPEASVTARLQRVRHTEHGDFVYAQMTIEGSARTLTAATLDCVSLRVGQWNSRQIYVASVASVSSQDYPARDGRVSVPVYWTMPGNNVVSEKDFRDARLNLESPQGKPCFTF